MKFYSNSTPILGMRNSLPPIRIHMKLVLRLIGEAVGVAIAGPAPSDRLALGPTILILVEV